MDPKEQLETNHTSVDTNGSPLPEPISPTDCAAKRARKRNKPSLSCEACTLKKTKCDRGRPTCLACMKRRSTCHYSQLADAIEESHRALGIESPRKKPKQIHAPPLSALPHRQDARPVERRSSRSSTGSSPMLLSNMPFCHPTASSLFKAEHPFSNYWTLSGGLAEVVQVLPSKDQSDILIGKYFEVVDPIYPMIDQAAFRQGYDHVWFLSPLERSHVDGSVIALIFVMLAMGTQFVALPSPAQKEQTAEFYVSASHQALRMFSYLSRPSLRSVQTMVLITYFLMNDNHGSDAYAFAGILNRQAYALGLNRDPSIVVPNASPYEMQQRRKLWQAVFLQDTFFTIILKLPPTATHTDVRVEDLDERDEDPNVNAGANDVSYIRSFWNLANLCQTALCSPRSLSLPISESPAARSRLVALFHRLYTSFPLPFRTFSEAAICELARHSTRLARQTLFLTSNYYHCLMLVHADESEDLLLDLKGTLDAAHEAINSFFLLHTLFECEARVWFHFQQRAFSEALVIAELIKNKPEDFSATDPLYIRAKNDLSGMIGILQLSSEADMVSRTRGTRWRKTIQPKSTCTNLGVAAHLLQRIHDSTLDGSPSQGNRRLVEPSIISSEVPPQDGYQVTKMSAGQELGYKHATRSAFRIQGRCSQAILLQKQLLVLNPIHERDDQPVRLITLGYGAFDDAQSRRQSIHEAQQRT